MGFKCPVCLKDYGKDTKQWNQHIKEAHSGIGKDIATLVTKIVEQEKHD